MPERERLNIDFGFAPTQVQQRDIGAAYAAPVAKKSAKTKMFEGLSALSGTLAKAAIARTKRLRAEEEKLKNLSPDEKSRLNALSQGIARAETEDEKEKIMRDFYKQDVQREEKRAIYSPYIEDATKQYEAGNEINDHFSEWLKLPETQGSLSDSDVNISEVFAQQLGEVQWSSDDVASYANTPRANAVFNSILNSNKNQYQARQQAVFLNRVEEEFTHNTTLAIDATIMNGGDIGTSLALQGQTFNGDTGKNGAKEVIAASVISYNDMIADGNLQDARKLVDALNKGDYFQGNPLAVYDAETVGKLRVDLLKREGDEQVKVDKDYGALGTQYKSDLTTFKSRYINDLFESGKDLRTMDVDDVMEAWDSQFSPEPGGAVIEGGRTSSEYTEHGVWSEARNSLRTTLQSMKTASDTTDFSWEQTFITEVLYQETPQVVNSRLTAALQNGEVSLDDFKSYKKTVEALPGISEGIKEFYSEYDTYKSTTRSKINNKLSQLSDLDFSEKIMSKFNNKEIEMQGHLIEGRRLFYLEHKKELSKQMRLYKNEELTLEQVEEIMSGHVDSYLENLAELSVSLDWYDSMEELRPALVEARTGNKGQLPTGGVDSNL